MTKTQLQKQQRVENNKHDKEWAKKIREAAKGKCELCHSASQYLQSHHLLCRRHRPTRWLAVNGVALCPSCHKFGIYSVHRNPFYALEKLRENKGEEWYRSVLNMVEYIK